MIDQPTLPSRTVRRGTSVLMVVLALAAGACTDTGGDVGDTAPPSTALVVRTDLADETTFDGTLGRPEAEPVAAGSPGVVTATPTPGTVLTSGDILFVVDDRPVVVLEGAVPAFRDLGYGSTRLDLPAGRAGTVTWLPPEGAVVAEGDVIVRIDEVPVVALTGELPMYRRLASGVDDGTDVRQLEEALVRLGYDPDGEVTVDETFSAATAAMVRRWQDDLGVADTGRVEVTDVVFSALPAQVVSLVADVGTPVQPASPLMVVTGGNPLRGPDVAQLEAALAALGHLDRADDTLDVDTIEAIGAFQVAAGLPLDGILAVGEVVFREGPVRTADVLAPVGSSVTPQTQVLLAASLETVVRVDLPASDQGALGAGDAVIVELPDRSETPGTVTSVATVASAGQPGQAATFAVEIALDDPAAAGDLDEAPVKVRAVTDTRSGVLAVPVTALLALAEGGYALEVVDPDGTTRLVAVEPGFFAGGLVEVEGGIGEGDRVIVP
jgi:peptidoglycan hydrolase-like protein with peptidoglycan-binding domain